MGKEKDQKSIENEEPKSIPGSLRGAFPQLSGIPDEWFEVISKVWEADAEKQADIIDPEGAISTQPPELHYLNNAKKYINFDGQKWIIQPCPAETVSIPTANIISELRQLVIFRAALHREVRLWLEEHWPDGKEYLREMPEEKSLEIISEIVREVRREKAVLEILAIMRAFIISLEKRGSKLRDFTLNELAEVLAHGMNINLAENK